MKLATYITRKSYLRRVCHISLVSAVVDRVVSHSIKVSQAY